MKKKIPTFKNNNEQAAIGAHASKGQSEQDLFRRLHGTLRAGDILLADALCCSYFQIATLQAAGVDVNPGLSRADQ